MTALATDTLIVRPPTHADIPAIIDLFTTCSLELVGYPELQANDLEVEWSTPRFNIETDILTIWTPEGQAVAYAEVWDTSPTHARVHAWTRVHPEYRGQGLGTQLLEWVERRASQAVALAEPHVQVALIQGAHDSDARSIGFLEQHGYVFNRFFLQMRVELDATAPATPVPDGIVIRSYDPATELRAVVEATDDSFKDHWGHIDEPLEEVMSRFENWIKSEDYDPELFLVALDGDKIAGVSLCWKKTTEDPAMGWIGTLGVRRAWRGKGLAKALLHHSFDVFRARGQKRVGLGVDGQSLTGATKLYESVGMRAFKRYNNYEKILRPGVDLRTQEL